MTDARLMDGYIRVSRVAGRGGESYLSPRIQRERIEQWASYKDVTIAEWHVDEDWSGGTHKRPGLELAIKRALEGETEGIVSASIDRFSRTTELGLRDLRRLEGANARLAFVVEDIDTGTVYGKMIYTILLAVAEAFLSNIKAGFLATKRRAVARGAYVSRTPWGYARNADGTLSPHPERAAIVAEAFRLASGDSLRTATEYLLRVAPERDWNATKTRRLLAQRCYLGETRNGDLVQADTHEALVTRVVWEAAQSTPQRRAPAAEFPLSKILTCETCGGPMVGGRGGKLVRTYRCAGSLSTSRRTCPQGANVTAEIAEKYLRGVLSDLLRDLRASVTSPEADTLAELELAVIEAEGELDAFAADLTARRRLGSRYHEHLDARADAVDRAREAYAKQARQAQEELSLTATDLLDVGDPESFSTLLRGLFESIFVRPGRGAAIEDRLVLVPRNTDRTTGVAPAQKA